MDNQQVTRVLPWQTPYLKTQTTIIPCHATRKLYFVEDPLPMKAIYLFTGNLFVMINGMQMMPWLLAACSGSFLLFIFSITYLLYHSSAIPGGSQLQGPGLDLFFQNISLMMWTVLEQNNLCLTASLVHQIIVDLTKPQECCVQVRIMTLTKNTCGNQRSDETKVQSICLISVAYSLALIL